jgi:poly(hydroxyalkanoate) depolymerase family esterase
MERATFRGGGMVAATCANAFGSRAYKLFVPSGYQGQPVPLVVMLHGCTQTPDDFAASTRMNAFAERETFLVAYPAQARAANGRHCWNWFDPAHQRRDAGEPSLIAALTRQLLATYAVDQHRVYVAGMSAGGAMAAILAATYPDLYAAAAVHSGLPYGGAHDLRSAFAAMRANPAGTAGFRSAAPAAGAPALHGPAIPLIVFHGARDTTVACANAELLAAQWTGSVGLQMCTEVSRGSSAAGRTWTRTRYADAAGRALVEQWIVDRLGHAWSGGSRAGTFADPAGPDASAEMLRFFAECTSGR